MPNYDIKLNGASKKTPINFKTAEIALKRDEVLKGVLRSFSSEMEFAGDAFTLIKTAYDGDFCDSVSVEFDYSCEGTPAQLFDGDLFLTDVQIDHRRCTAKAEIQDNHYSAKIYNNRKVKAYIGVGRSKNDSTYTAATAQTTDFFQPTTGGFPAALLAIETYTVPDAFEDLVNFMTDGAVGFTNNYTDIDDYHIFDPRALNNTGSTGFAPYLSFEQLFEGIAALFNIGFYIDTSGPTLVIDELSNIYDTTNTLTITNVRELTEEIDTSRLYGNVKVGCVEHNAAGSTYQWPDVQYFNHREEEYHTSGTCNTDATLDITCKLIYDSNVIEEVVESVAGGFYTDAYDGEIFLTEVKTGKAVQYSTFAKTTYNELLANSAIIPRFDGVIYSDLSIFLGDGNDGFEATETGSASYGAAGAAYEPITYDTEVSDPNNNYDNATNFCYTAPQDGWYRFECSAEISNYSPTGGPALSGDLDTILTIRHYDGGGFGGGNLITAYASPTTTVTADTEVTYTHTGFFMSSGDQCRIRVDATWNGGNPTGASFDIDGGTFKTLQAETGGGRYATFDKDDARVVIFDFEVALDHSDFETIQANPTQAITFNVPNGTTKKGWIQELYYNLFSKIAKFKIITSRNT